MSKTNKVEMQLFEKVDFEKLQLMISSDELDEDIRNQLKAYFNKKSGDSVPVNYSYSKNLSQKGRLYAQNNLSLQNFKSEIRHALAKNIYHDIDMENAGPRLIMQFCKKNNIECPKLAHYVNNREEVLNKIIKYHKIVRQDAKDLMIKLCYLGKYKVDSKEDYCQICGINEKDYKGKYESMSDPWGTNKWACGKCVYGINKKREKIDNFEKAVDKYREDNDIDEPSERKLKYLIDFSEEMNKIAKKVCEIEKDTFNEVVKNKDKPNKKSTTLSITGQVLENKCLMAMYEFFKSQKITVGVLCFDGLMIEKNKKIDDKIAELLISCEKYVFDKVKYNIKLSVKPMDKELTFELPKYTAYVDSDKSAADKLLLIEGRDKFKHCKGDFYVYDERTGIFEKNKKTQPTTLYYYLMKNKDYLNITIGKTEKSYGTDSSLMKKVIDFILPECTDDHWLHKVANTSLGYLLFKDGIYDFKKCKFTRGFNPKIVFYSSVPWDFPQRDEDEIKKAFKISFGRLFEDPAPIIAALARALAGDTYIKKFYFCPGKTNAGKSVLINMLQKAFGQYVSTFNAENISYKKRNSNDEAQQMRWAMLLRFSRILMSNELKMNNSLDGESIKKHSAGTDNLTGRGHGDNEYEFKPHYTIFCMLNDIPKITNLAPAVLGRLEYVEFPYQFVNKEDVKKKKTYKVKDMNIEDKISDEAFIRGFIYIILDAYQQYMEEGMPEFDKETKDRWTAENQQGNEIIDKIKEYYEITEDKDDKVTIAEFKKFRENHKKVFGTISGPRFNDILKDDLNLELKRNGDTRHWIGIKKREIVEI